MPASIDRGRESVSRVGQADERQPAGGGRGADELGQVLSPLIATGEQDHRLLAERLQRHDRRGWVGRDAVVDPFDAVGLEDRLQPVRQPARAGQRIRQPRARELRRIQRRERGTQVLGVVAAAERQSVRRRSGFRHRR